MHLYLKDGDQRRRIEGIQLKDGFCPCVSETDTYFSDPNTGRTILEPAIWFKVLVLDSVSVDCNQRVVSWSTGKKDESDQAVVHSSSYSEGECYDYDADVDDLFNLASKVMNCSECDEDYKQCLLRMLHCYILPKIVLHKEDIDKIQKAMDAQVECIQALDEEVLAHCHGIESCYKELEILRTDFLPDLEDMINNRECSKGFLEMLLSDVRREESNIRLKVDKAQDNVQQLKTKVDRNPILDDAKTELAAARLERDKLQDKVGTLIVAREDIKCWLPHVVDNTEFNADSDSMVQSYLQCRERLLLLKQERDKFLQHKSCALSVREIMEGVLNILDESEATDGNDANDQGRSSFDVLQGDWRPEWQRLGERVATIVNNEEHPVGESFQSFCKEIIGQCQCVIDMGKKSDSQKSRTSTISCTPFGRIEDDAGYEMSNYGFEDFVSDFFKQELEKISGDISNHLMRATELLADQFNHWENYFKNKLRLCYEQCFFKKTHCFVECVYDLAHHKHVEEMENDVKRLRKLPIKLLDLQMKDEWWLALFEQRVRIESVGQQTIRTVEERNNEAVNGYTGLLGSYDMIDELTDEELSENSNDVRNADLNCVSLPVSYNDVENFRSLTISAIRERSKTFSIMAEESDCSKIPNQLKLPQEDFYLSHSVPNPHLSLSDIVSQWENNEIAGQTARRFSKSQNDITKRGSIASHSEDTFQEHFGPALQSMRDILRAASPLAKLKCLTASLKKITSKVSQLRQRDGIDQFKAAVTAEDLLPLLVLMLLQLEPWESAVMWPQLQLIEDLMAPCLRSGCHGWALAQFQLALRFLSRLCHEF